MQLKLDYIKRRKVYELPDKFGYKKERRDKMNYYLSKDNNIKLYNCDCNFFIR